MYQLWPDLGIFWQFSNGSMVFDDSKWYDDPEDFVGLKVISNKSVDFDDPKEFHGSQVFHDPKGILRKGFK